MIQYGVSAELWVIIGAVLIVIEIAATAFIPAFFGMGALITALFTWVGLTEGLASQLLCFSMTSIASLLLFRTSARRLFARGSSAMADYSDFMGQRAVVTEDIKKGGQGMVSFRGADWIALSKKAEDIPRGTQVVITEIEGIKLYVESLTS